MVDWSLDRLVRWVGVLVLARDPSNVAAWERNNLLGLATDVSQLGSVERTTLQVKAVERDRSALIELAAFEGRNKLKLIDSHLKLASGALSESVQEGFRMQ